MKRHFQLKKKLKKIVSPRGLFLTSLLIYLFSRFYQIETFPIYFFCDEAIQAVLANNFLANRFRDDFGNFFPSFFQNFFHYDLGFSVYANLPGVLFLGKKVWVVRATTALISFLGAWWTSLILKKIFQLKNYWAGVLFLAVTPIFFLHSRTGFETVMATSFYAGFFYYYLLARIKNRKYIFFSLFLSALSFYSYAGIWVVIIASLVVFFLLDWRYFLDNKKHFIAAMFWGLILFWPFFNFQRHHPDLVNDHLSRYRSYLVSDLSRQEKINQLVKNYRLSYSPSWLFSAQSAQHPRHSLKGYGRFLSWTAPLVGLGLVYLLLRFKKPACRLILASILLSPLGGVVIEPSVTRNMPMVIVVAILFGLGVKRVSQIEKRVARVFFLFFAAMSFFITFDSVKNGPFWFDDYGLYGMQYGAKQLYDEVNRALDECQWAYVPTAWANGSDIFAHFFLSPEKHKRVKFVEPNCGDTYDSSQNIAFFVMDNIYQKLQDCRPLFKMEVIRVIANPNGQPQFYFLKLD